MYANIIGAYEEGCLYGLKVETAREFYSPGHLQKKWITIIAGF